MARIKWNEYLSGRYKGVDRKPKEEVKEEVKEEPKAEPKTDNKIVGNGGNGGVEIPKASDRRIKNMFGL
jgi:hypothetical protein